MASFNSKQRKHIADKLADAANLSLGALVFTQITQKGSLTIIVSGILISAFFWSLTIYLLQERKTWK